MKILLIALVLFTLGACTAVPLSPTAVSPAATDIANNIKAVIAAANGDCSLPITPTSMSASCQALPDTTTTQQQNIDSIIACALAGGNTRLSATFTGLKAGLCASSTTATLPVVTTPAPVSPPKVTQP